MTFKYKMKMDKFKQFLADRPAVSLRAICKEAGLEYSGVYRALHGERPWRSEYDRKLEPIMRKYGYG